MCAVVRLPCTPARKTSMTANSANDQVTPASTSGGAGFTFEDLAGAYLAAALLAGSPVLGSRFGALGTIAFQQTHRPLDDVVVTSSSLTPNEWAGSIKRFDMLRGPALLGEFASEAWAELTAPAFDDQRQFVGFVSGPTADGAWRSVQKLITHATTHEPEALAEKIARSGAYNATDRDIWASAEAPPDALADDDDAVASPARFLSRLIPLRLDVEDANSQDLAQAKQWCDLALQPGQQLGADELWSALVGLVHRVRPNGGSIDYERICRDLPQFSFVGQPDASPDWHLLDAHTEGTLALVRDDLGDGLQLPRAEAWAEMQRFQAAVPLGYLIGPSGCGKTALAKRWVREGGHRSLWLSADDLADGIAGLNSRLGLRLGLVKDLELGGRPLRIVIDGLDRNIHGQHFQAAAALARKAGSSGGRTQVLVTTQQLALSSVTAQMLDSNAPHDACTITIGNFDGADIAKALEARPELEVVVHRGQLQGVLERPKLMQVVLDATASIDPEALGPISNEADVAELWWDKLALSRGERTARSEFLLGLGRRHGDELIDALPAGSLGNLAPFAGAVDGLRRDGILASDESRYAFAHDLFGDWTRYRMLGDDESVATVIEKSALPPWHRAIRLRALTRLERHGTDAWKQDHAQLEAAHQHLAADLHLDAPLFAADPDHLLRELWPTLVAEDGRLLKRLLRRFMHVATSPDPRGAEIFRDAPEIATYWAATSRIPLPAVWAPVLRVLHAHASDAVDSAPVQTAEVIETWLRLTPRSFLLRAEAAEVAFPLAESLTRGKLSGLYDDDEAQKLWTAVLAAGAEQPEAVADLAGALLTPPEEAEADEGGAELGMVTRPANWRQARQLRRAVLSESALAPLITADPERARDVLLAGVFEWRPRRRRSRMFGTSRELGLTDEPRWRSPHPDRGPFRAFLHLAEDEAVEAIVALTEKATERWSASERSGGDGPPETFEIYRNDAWIELRGDASTMHWHRGDGHAPAVLASALMAIEAHVYRELDSGNDVSGLLERLLELDLVAVAGLLASVACYQPGLLRGPLAPLVTSAALLENDRLYKFRPNSHLMIPTWTDPVMGRQVQEWHNMKHRQRPLWSVAMSYALAGSALATTLAHARAHWEGAEGDRYRYLVAEMDPANWMADETVGDVRALEYKPPAELQPEIEESTRTAADRLFTLTGPYELRKWIDEPGELSDERFDAVWEQWRERMERTASDAEIPHGRRLPADLECGLAAFLVIHGGEWLGSHPEAAAWCRASLLEPVAEPPPTPDFDSPEERTAEKWDGFCADAIPVLWADAPDEVELRRAVGRLAIHRHLETVRRVFASVSAQPALADDLVRLERMALHWARFVAWLQERQHREETAQHARDFGGEAPVVDDLSDLAEPTERVCKAFTDGSLSAEPVSLAAFIAETPDEMIGSQDLPRHRFHALFSVEHLVAAFHHLLVLPQTAPQPLRERAIGFAADLASALGASLVPDEGEREVEIPYEAEQTLLDALARLVPRLSPAEARPIWEPILAAGRPAEFWLDWFLREIWRAATGQTPVPADFPETIKLMFAFVRERPSWQVPAWRGEMELNLAGMDRYGVGTYTAVHAPLFAALQPEWGQWVREHLGNAFFAMHIARFLKSPAADLVLADGLSWLAEREAADDASADDDLDSALGELLTYLASSREHVFRQHDETGRAVRVLLHALAGRQRPIGLELVARLS